MAAGFEYFTSSDVGAPTLTGLAGSMVTLLDWVLVSKGGWAKAFSGTNTASYRSDTGNRFYLNVLDNQTKLARVRAYRAMTSVTSGTSPFPNNTQFADFSANSYGWVKSYTADSLPRRYWGIRTNKYLLLFIEFQNVANESGNYRSCVAFGDFPSSVVGDTHNTCVLSAGSLDTYPYAAQLSNITVQGPESQMSFPTGSQNLSLSGSPNGSIVSPSAVLSVPYKVTATTGNTLATGSTAFISGNTIVSANVTTGGAVEALPRGKMPNLSVIFGGYTNKSNANYPTYDLQQFTVASKTYLAIGEMAYDPSGSENAAGVWLLEITDTDGAL